MNKTVYRTVLLCFSSVLNTSPVLADPPPPSVPQVQFVDASGTDLISLVTSVPAPRIDVNGISFKFAPTLPPYRHNYSDAIVVQEDPYIGVTHDFVTFEGKSYQFSPVSGQSGLWIFKPERQSQGSSLVQINTTTYQLTTPDGTIVTYDASFRSSEYAITNEPALLTGNPDSPGFLATAISATRADGEKLDYYYSTTTNGLKNLRAIKSSLGWIIKIDSQIFSRTYNSGTRIGAEPNKVYIINSAMDYCDPIASVCTTTSGPSRREINITTANGFEFIYRNKSLAEIFRNKYSTPTVNGGYSFPSGQTFAFSRPGFGLLPVQNGNVQVGQSTWSYNKTIVDTSNVGPTFYTAKTTSTNPDGKTRQVKFYALQQVPIESINEIGSKTIYQFDDDRFLIRQIDPEATYSGSSLTGGYSEYSYDARRNLTQIRAYPKGGGVPLTQYFSYEGSCNSSNFRFCNRVKSHTDNNGNITNYVYSADHGGIVSETYPADVNGLKRQIRYFHQQISPTIALSGGGFSSSTPIWRITKKSECVVSAAADPASCIGTATETIEEYSYNAKNLTMASKLVKLGNGTVLSTDNYTYGYFGEILSITSLQSGLDTKKYYVYDTDGKITHEIWPDPDATGPLSRKIVKYVYDADGRKVETQDGYGSMTDGTDFVWQQKVRLTYDSSTGQLAKRETVTP